MNASCASGCLCDCCLGTTQQTPRSIVNPQGLTSLRYRIGTHGDFFASMLAALGTVEIPADAAAPSSIGMIGGLLRGSVLPSDQVSSRPLEQLTARTTDDPSIALLDAWAIVLDVLTFYQERIAVEGYLRTASEFRSVLELARLVGYQPRPGVAANSFLAYSVEKGPPVTINAGSRAQSVPESGQLPQTFETSDDLFAQYRWNALNPRLGQPQIFLPGQTTAGKRAWFNGLNTLLKPNDPLIVVFDTSKGEPFRVKKVATDNTAQTTMVVLQDFTTMALLADGGKALIETQRQMDRALFAYTEAESARVGSGGAPNEKFEQVKAIIDTLREAAASLVEIKYKDIQNRVLGPLSDKLAELRKDYLPAATDTGNLFDLIIRLQGVEEYLNIQNTSVQMGELILSGSPSTSSTVSKEIQSQFDALSEKWKTESLRNLSPTTLANLLFETSEFIVNDLDKLQPTPLVDQAHQIVRDKLPTVVQSIVRSIVTRFTRPAQAGLIIDAQLTNRVYHQIQPLQEVLSSPKLKSSDLQSLADRLGPILADKIPAITKLVGEARTVRNNLDATSGPLPDTKAFLDSIQQVDRIQKAIQAVIDKFKDIEKANDNTNQNTVISQIDALRQQAGTSLNLPLTEKMLMAAFDSLNESGTTSEQFVIKANTWRDLWRASLPDANNYATALRSVLQKLNDSGLQPDIPSTRDALKVALETFLGTNLQPDAEIDIQPDVVRLGTKNQFDSIAAVTKRLSDAINDPGAQDTVLDSLNQLGLLNSEIDDWIGKLDTITKNFSSQGTSSEFINAIKSILIDEIKPTSDIINFVSTKIAQDQSDDSRRIRISIWSRVISIVKDKLAQPLDDVVHAASEVKNKLLQQTVTEEFLALLHKTLDGVRQQQRLAQNAAYPRILPWLDEFVGTLDQFISDLAVKASLPGSPNDDSVTFKSAGDPFPDLERLNLPPSAQPPSPARLMRGLPVEPASGGDESISAQTSDLGPQIAIAFNQRLSGAVYEGFTNAKLARANRFQGIHVLRGRSAPFGHNVPMRIRLQTSGLVTLGVRPANTNSSMPTPDEFPADPVEWDLVNRDQKNVLKLDAVFDKITPGSFVVIERAVVDAQFELDNPLVARVEAVATVSCTDYGQPGTTITQLTLDRPWLGKNDTKLGNIRDVTVYLQSEPLDLGGEPIDADIGPVPGFADGATIDLDEVYDGLPSGRWLIVAGERTDIPNTTGVKAAEFVMIAGATQVADAVGSTGQGRPHTVISLASPLAYSYQRGSVTIYGNVVKADQGETKSEILGAGQATAAGQKFDLKQQPLTYLAAANPMGATDTLQVRVNGVLWPGVPSLYDMGPNDQGYVLRTDDAAKTSVLFGDGEHGTRLPTGVDNVRAVYRVGLGSPGNVAAGKITNLVSRPLGVKDVTNPLPAVGGVDRENTDQARRNAPLGVTALDRLVSTPDYEDFTRAYAGVEKAYAANLSDGFVQRLHLTIAGRDGDEISKVSDLYRNLIQTLRNSGDPSLPITVESRRLRLIVIVARLRVLPDYEFDPVVLAVREQMYKAFGFESREFGQDVILSDVLATIQSVRGVEAVVVENFGTVDERSPDGTTLTPIAALITSLQNIPKFGSAQFQSRIAVRKSRVGPGGIIPAEIALLSDRVADTLILNEWKS